MRCVQIVQPAGAVFPRLGQTLRYDYSSSHMGSVEQEIGAAPHELVYTFRGGKVRVDKRPYIRSGDQSHNANTGTELLWDIADFSLGGSDTEYSVSFAVDDDQSSHNVFIHGLDGVMNGASFTQSMISTIGSGTSTVVVTIKRVGTNETIGSFTIVSSMSVS